MKREWFEPGPDGMSPFEREWRRTGKNDFGGCISAAFRALLAGEDVGRTADAKDAEIARLTAEVDEWKKFAVKATNDCENMGRISEALHARNDEIVGLRAEVERLEEIVKDTNNVLDVMTRDLAAERDALQARVDAGVMAWEKWKQQCGSLWLWAFPGVTASPCWAEVCDALNAQPDHIADAAMVDERKGEEIVNSTGIQYRGHWLPFHDRRRTPGTIADRGQAS